MTPATLSAQQMGGDESRCTGYATEPLCRSCVRYLQIERDRAQASGYFFWHVNPALANGECHNRIPFEAPQ